MKTVLVIDTCSIFDFQKFYVFDKHNGKEIYSKLTDFLLSKIKSGEIVVIDKVYCEMKISSYTDLDKKFFKEAIKPFSVDTFYLFTKVEDLIKHNRKESMIESMRYSDYEVEQMLRPYEENYADLYLIAYCLDLKKQGIYPILISEETLKKDNKLIEKIPTICKKEGVEFRKIPYCLFEIYKNELNFELKI